MTENEQDREIGKMIRERQNLVTRQVCLLHKAEGIAHSIQHFANVLSAASKREKWARPGYEGYPSGDDVRSLLEDIAGTDKALSALDANLEQLGIKPHIW